VAKWQSDKGKNRPCQKDVREGEGGEQKFFSPFIYV
jgi:hypothetical protein